MNLRKPHRFRVLLLGMLFCVLAAAVGGRLVDLQYAEHDYYARRADGQHRKRVTLLPERGMIADRNGRALAQSAERLTIYINPRIFREPDAGIDLDQLQRDVSVETGLPLETVRSRFAADRVLRLVQRVMPDRGRSLSRVLADYEPSGRGHWVVRESARLYPKHIAAAAIGFCQRGEEGETPGLAGIELAYDEDLRGKIVELEAERSGARQTLNPWSRADLNAAKGNTLMLTLDANVQEASEQALRRAVEEHEASAGGVVVMEANTGAVVAMASYPTFDNNDFGDFPADHRRNRVITDPFETGSVVKLFTAAMLLDKGIVTPETLIDCEGGFAVVDGRRLRDSPGHYLDVATFREVLRWSSNIGIAKAAQVLENNEWHAALRAFGFGGRTGIDLPGEGSGLLYPVGQWTRFSRTSLPMGYEIGITPLQTAAGLAALVNGGVYYEPFLVKEIISPEGQLLERREPKIRRRVIRPTTSIIMRDLMEDIVVEGTGKKARVPGYRIGGKTGTTRKSDVFTHREYIASFAGALPIHDPSIVLYVYIDNPQGQYYASSVAAPLFQEVAAACVLHLGIPPTERLSVAGAEAEKLQAMPPSSEAQRSADNTRLGFLGRMPNFQGMTMAEARRSLPATLQQVRFAGTGMVADQFPAPGEPFTKETQAVLHFAPGMDAPAPQEKGG